jgi:hypothetical protein
MRLDRQLARILAAVIVMIAAYLAPSAVQAHAGHHHPAPTAVVAAEVISPAAQTTSAATTVLSATPSAVWSEAKAIDVVAGAADPGARVLPKTCTGSCCCNTGMACCTHALTADTDGSAVMGAASRLAAIPGYLARPGADPEALPKPPRSFA